MSEEHEHGHESHLTLETLISAIILIVYTISAPLFEKYHFHYMHESGMCMFIGIIITLFLRVLTPGVNILKIKLFKILKYLKINF